MKTKLTSRNALFYVFLNLLFWGISFPMYAQCPTIANSNPPPICDASGFTFSDLNAFATDGGNGIVWYDMLTGGTPFNTNELVQEGTYYADDNSGTCGARVSIVVDFQVNASGENLDRIYCTNENATIQTYIDDVLLGSIPPGGSVEVYTDFALTNQANPTDAIPVGASNYYIVFVDNGGCEGQIEIGQVGVFSAPTDPTPPTPQEFCSDSNPLVGNLDPGTTATNFNWYANLDGMGNPILPALPLSTPLVDGNTYYIQVDDIFCVSNPVAVVVNIEDPVDAGTSGNLEYCSDNLPGADFNLFDELGGTPDTSGTWAGPLATSNGHLGTVNIATLTVAGVYTFTYTVPGSGACPDAISSVVITVYETLTSGIPSAADPATFCESGVPSAFDLFTLLDNEDPNGQWTAGTTSTDPVVTSPIDLTGFTAGTYNYTYTQNLLPNPCPEESTTVQVVVLPDPNAGIAVNQTFCENDLIGNSPFDLFNALDGSQDNNSGTWTDAGSNTISNPIDITSFTVAGSPYLFTYTIDNGTCSDSEQISITIEDAPESGTPVATMPEYCEGSAPSSYNLFDALENEDQTGTWYAGPDNTGATVANPIDLSGFTAGTYDFTFDVDAIGSCDDVLVTVQVTIHPLPNSGVDNSPAPICENNPILLNTSFNIRTYLAGEDAGGTWTDDSSTGALVGANTIDYTMLGIGTYNFTYTVTDANSCTSSTTITISIVDAPESGTPVATFPNYCEGSAPSSYNLFDLLEGEDQTGTWYAGPDNTGATVTNPTDLSGLTPGTYEFTFDVDAIGSCDDALVTVNITINPLPNTGTPSSATFCENDVIPNSPLDLFGLLSGEDSGGTWSDDDNSNALTLSNVDLTSLAIGSYNFTYTITDINNCTNSSTVTIVIEDAPESGTANAPEEFCISDITVGQTFNLFDLLTDEDQTGTWSDDDASGALSGNIVTVDGLPSGTYNFTFDVDAIGSCDDVNVTVSIVINDTPPPAAATPQNFCDAATVADLVATGNAVMWYDVPTGGTNLDSTTALVDGQIYYTSQTNATTSCESSVRTAVDVTIFLTPSAGDPSSTAIVACNDNNAIDLFTGLDGTEDAGGTWQNDDGVGSLAGNIFDATGVAPGAYQFTYLVLGSAPCVDDSQAITITIEGPLNAGSTINPTLDICSNNGTVDLFTLLGGADSGGVWSPALDSTTGLFDPLVDLGGTYTYTLTNSCGTFTNQVDVTVTQAPNAGTDNTVTLCAVDASVDLFTLLGNAQSGGTWTPALTSGTGVFDPAVDSPGVYRYTITAIAPCTPDNFAEITVTVNDSPPLVVLDPNPTFCLVDGPTVADLSGSVQATGTINWYEDAVLTIPANSIDALTNGQTYYGTQTDNTTCESSSSIQISVTVNDTATPTLDDASETYCINDNPTLSILSENIMEYNATADNLRWYDSATGGTPISNDSELSTTTYYVALIDASTGCESAIRLEVTPDITACGKLRLPDGFSPNGDGVNDTYDADNLALLYPNFEMEIYNRNGNLVYRGNANTPRFDGTSNQSRVAFKGELPVGVYFYVFNFNDGINKPEQGRLYLSR